MEQVTTIGSFVDFRAGFIQERDQLHQEWMKCEGDIKERLKFYDKYEEKCAEIKELEAEQIAKQLGDVLAPLIHLQLESEKKRAIEKLEELFTEYEELRKKGVSFAERAKLIDQTRVDNLSVIAKQVIPNKIEVLHPREWLEFGGGYDRLKELGITQFVKLNFKFMYDNKNNNESGNTTN